MVVEDGTTIDPVEGIDAAVQRLLVALGEVADAGSYAEVEVIRPWSAHNPRITGEFASVQPIRWYLERELGALLPCSLIHI